MIIKWFISTQRISRFYFCRSSLPEVFYNKGVLRNFAKFIGKHLCQSFFLSKTLHYIYQQCIINIIGNKTYTKNFFSTFTFWVKALSFYFRSWILVSCPVHWFRFCYRVIKSESWALALYYGSYLFSMSFEVIVGLCIYLSIYLSIYLTIYMWVLCIYMYILCVCVYVFVSMLVCIYVWICMYVYMYVYMCWCNTYSIYIIQYEIYII